MHRITAGVGALLAGWLVGLTPVDGQDLRLVFDRAEIHEAATAPETEAAARAVANLVSEGQTEQLVEEIRALLRRTDLGDIARERLLSEAVLGLATVPRTPTARELIDQLVDRPVVVFVWHEEGRHAVSVPFYDIGAAARLTRRTWLGRAAEQRAAELLAQGSDQFLVIPDDSSAPTVIEGISAAVERSGIEELVTQREAMSVAMRADPRIGAIAAVAAQRLRDAELFRETVVHAEARVAIRTLSEARLSLDETNALSVLADAVRRPEIASTALFELGRLAETSVAARDLLIRELADGRNGGSAAAALARLHDPSLAVRLGQILTSAPEETTRRRAALALKLDGSPAARAQLEYSVGQAPSSALEQEVTEWLGD